MSYKKMMSQILLLEHSDFSIVQSGKWALEELNLNSRDTSMDRQSMDNEHTLNHTISGELNKPDEQ
ncbi:hypothetical protein [Rhodohalobacter sp. SW132]|uniref:hypothetical protein n=1 Tax=Rhodohalobacter sp. SW132 TaxID=2293433 RepID=UPI0011C071B2|nr:hypothetical protein [Rhodohalobacter sp. SW132]